MIYIAFELQNVHSTLIQSHLYILKTSDSKLGFRTSELALYFKPLYIYIYKLILPPRSNPRFREKIDKEKENVKPSCADLITVDVNYRRPKKEINKAKNKRSKEDGDDDPEEEEEKPRKIKAKAKAKAKAKGGKQTQDETDEQDETENTRTRKGKRSKAKKAEPPAEDKPLKRRRQKSSQ